MKRVLFLLTVLLLVSIANADLIISEYVEGSSYNKALELYNTSGAVLDLNDFQVKAYHNGKSTPSYTIDLAGYSVAADDVIVLCHPSADSAILNVADIQTSSISFNGDDAIELLYNGSVIDSFGQVGVDPGSSWDGGGKDVTLRRMATILTGDTDSSNYFTAATEWDSYSKDTFDGLGSHVPEPMTIAILSLGGIFLRRRK